MKKIDRSGATWSEERVERVRSLWARGYSIRTIADEIGLSPLVIEARIEALELPDQPPFRAENFARPAMFSLDEHPPFGCSWPLGKATFCDAKVLRSRTPYCAMHAGKAHD